jgi:hypothetical protein
LSKFDAPVLRIQGHYEVTKDFISNVADPRRLTGTDITERHLVEMNFVHFRTGKRQGKKISLTRAGAQALKRWLATPVPDWVTGVPPDPLRTRVRFLAACSRKLQREFLASAYRQALEHLRAVESDCRKKRKAGLGFEYLMALGAFLSMQSRCEFLQRAGEMLDMRVFSDAKVSSSKA